MREILFRGKSEILGWIEGWYCPEVKWGEHYFPVGITHKTKEGWLDDVVVIPETIGQYTGLTDKNGKKIFDSDIVRCISTTDMANMVVIFEDGEFRMVLCEKYKDYVAGCGFYAIRCFDKEVIGNIHDNPELLEDSL